MTLAAAYIRESTIAQGDRYGPDAQRAAISAQSRTSRSSSSPSTPT
jgi:hypothetical protein